MSQPHFDPAELRDLLHALCEETIAPEQHRRLEELLLSSPEAEAYYVQYLSMHADLIKHFAVMPSPSQVPGAALAPGASAETPAAALPSVPLKTSGAARRHVGKVVGLLALAAGLLLVFLLLPGKQPPDPGDRPPKPIGDSEATDDSVAFLHHTLDAVWEESELPTRQGAPLRPGTLRLKAGYAHIEFYSGATVILEGPAELKLLSRTEAYCTRGRLRATVPPAAQGFTIGSPKLDLVDRGTEFGLVVGDKTEVHVFQGEVDLYDPATRREGKHRKLLGDEGVLQEPSGELKSIKVDRKAFQTAENLEARSLDELRKRHDDWREASMALRRDPGLALYYPFDPAKSKGRMLLDERAAKEKRHGAIVGCNWTAGRWQGRKGLEFKQVSDRVRVHVPGEFSSITLTTWVRIDGLPNRNNALFMADGWDEGELHWQIGSDGTIILGVQANPKGKGAHYHAPAAITPDHYGRWLHLAVVYDHKERSVIHYIDGVVEVELKLEFDIPLRIGDAELGNWNIATHRNTTPIRYLTGAMDEFMLFGEALSKEKIAEIHEQGRPPS